MTPLTVGSMFSGIGGLDLGLERAGMTVAWQSEIDPYCCRVLAKHWPDVPNIGDVTTIHWSEVPRVDLICGGYPCQPFSQAGRRLGDRDPRHLWPWMLNAIRVLRPRWALLENVAGHLALGFDRVLADLAGLGFDVEWSLISACSMGAPHMRERLYVVAHANSDRWRWQRGWLPRPDVINEAWNVSQRPEPDVRRVADGTALGVDRKRALGNAVVPQVAEHIGRLIVEQVA